MEPWGFVIVNKLLYISAPQYSSCIRLLSTLKHHLTNFVTNFDGMIVRQTPCMSRYPNIASIAPKVPEGKELGTNPPKSLPAPDCNAISIWGNLRSLNKALRYRGSG